MIVFDQAAEGDEAADEECEDEGSGEGGDDIEAILALGGKCKKKASGSYFLSVRSRFDMEMQQISMELSIDS